MFFCGELPAWCKVFGTETSAAKVKPRSVMSSVSAHRRGLRSVSHVVLQLGSLRCIQEPSVKRQLQAQSLLFTVLNVTRSSCLSFCYVLMSYWCERYIIWTNSNNEKCPDKDNVLFFFAISAVKSCLSILDILTKGFHSLFKCIFWNTIFLRSQLFWLTQTWCIQL